MRRTAVRRFRGVGRHPGRATDGRGELQDLLAVVEQVAPWTGDGAQPLALAGFSFGAFVTSHALVTLWPQRHIDRAVLVGTAASRFTVARCHLRAHLRTLVVHGEQDDTVALSAVMDWRAQTLLSDSRARRRAFSFTDNCRCSKIWWSGTCSRPSEKRSAALAEPPCAG